MKGQVAEDTGGMGCRWEVSFSKQQKHLCAWWLEADRCFEDTVARSSHLISQGFSLKLEAKASVDDGDPGRAKGGTEEAWVGLTLGQEGRLVL